MELNSLLKAEMLMDINISTISFLYALLSSATASLILRSVYLRYGRSMNNREYFANIFLLLSIATCGVIIVVKYSLALSLGLVGALSIVRFRAAIKEPEELVYLFLAIVFGLAFGANQFAVGFLLLFFSVGIIFLSSRFLMKNNQLNFTGLVIILSGERNQIMSIYENDLSQLLNMAVWATVKEVDYENGEGRLVIRCSSGGESQLFVDKLVKLSNEHGININLITDVSVPA